MYLSLGYGKIILELKSNHNAKSKRDASYGEDQFWTSSNRKQVKFMETEFTVGTHCASRPTHFLPIIDHVQFLHNQGFVHGDIRAYNTVFVDDEGDIKDSQSRLIDLDFGGKAGEATYPKGYKRDLTDGDRIGNGDPDSANHVLQMRHDWYAFGRLVYSVHHFNPPKGHAGDENPPGMSFWMDIECCPSEEQIENLKKKLIRLDDEGWTVRPNQTFKTSLNGGTEPALHTKKGATGSPPKKTE